MKWQWNHRLIFPSEVVFKIFPSNSYRRKALMYHACLWDYVGLTDYGEWDPARRECVLLLSGAHVVAHDDTGRDRDAHWDLNNQTKQICFWLLIPLFFSVYTFLEYFLYNNLKLFFFIYLEPLSQRTVYKWHWNTFIVVQRYRLTN